MNCRSFSALDRNYPPSKYLITTQEFEFGDCDIEIKKEVLQEQGEYEVTQQEWQEYRASEVGERPLEAHLVEPHEEKRRPTQTTWEQETSEVRERASEANLIEPHEEKRQPTQTLEVGERASSEAEPVKPSGTKKKKKSVKGLGKAPEGSRRQEASEASKVERDLSVSKQETSNKTPSLGKPASVSKEERGNR